jgi:hypothetical protein
MFQNVFWMFSQSAYVVLCGFWMGSLLVVLVKEECPNIVEISQVKNFVSPLCFSSLLKTSRLGCLV